MKDYREIARKIAEVPEEPVELSDVDAEESLLASVLADGIERSIRPKTFAVISEIEPADFSVPGYGKAWAAVKGLVAEGCRELDPDIVGRRAGNTALGGALGELPIGQSNSHIHAEVVRDLSIKRHAHRSLQDGSREALVAGGDIASVLAQKARELQKLGSRRGDSSVVSGKAAAKRLIRSLEERCSGKNVGLSSGYAGIDKQCGRMMPGNLITVAGRPSMGKSALGLGMARGVMGSGADVLFFSMEMGAEELATRNLCALTPVRLNDMRDNPRSVIGRPVVAEAMNDMARWPFTIIDKGGLCIGDIEAMTGRHHQMNNTKLVVIDHLNLLVGDGRNRERDIADATGRLKAMSKALDLTVLLLCQLNRAVEGRDSKEPKLSDLRESGAIEQDSDIVLMLYRESYYDASADPGKATVFVRKHRNGHPVGIELGWIGNRALFEDL